MASDMKKYLVFSIAGLVFAGVLIVYPNLRVSSDSNIDIANQEIRYISKNLEAYFRVHGQYPSTEDGLEVLIPDYFKAVPTDPWREKYFYSSSGSDYVITHSHEGVQNSVSPNSRRAI